MLKLIRSVSKITLLSLLGISGVISYAHTCVQSTICPDNGCFPAPCAKSSFQADTYHCVPESGHCCMCTGKVYECKKPDGVTCVDTYIDWISIAHYESNSCNGQNQCIGYVPAEPPG